MALAATANVEDYIGISLIKITTAPKDQKAGYLTDTSVSAALALTNLDLTCAAVGAPTVACAPLEHVGLEMTYRSTCHPCRKPVK